MSAGVGHTSSLQVPVHRFKDQVRNAAYDSVGLVANSMFASHAAQVHSISALIICKQHSENSLPVQAD